MQLAFYTNFAGSLATQEAQLNTLQQQISTGVAVQTPDQNPAAYATGVLGKDTLASLTNDNNTQSAIQVRLGSASAAYQSTTDVLNNVQAVVEQALNGTTSPQNLQALAAQVQSASQQILSIGNQTAPDGVYLFGGSHGGAAPFTADGNGNVSYTGDGAQAQAAISPDGTASTIANGQVFVGSLAGNGVGTVAANAANAGTGQIISQGVVNAAAAQSFQTGTAPITVSFSVAGGVTSYSAVQSGTTVASGTLGSGTAANNVQLGGVDYQITGSPAAGDSFTISPSRPQSIFALLKTITGALSSAGSTPAQVAQTNQVLNQSLAGIQQYLQAVNVAQAQSGVTLNALTNAGQNNTAQATQVQESVNNATAVNTPAAIASLNQTLTSVQAALKTFAAVQQLSLFNYL